MIFTSHISTHSLHYKFDCSLVSPHRLRLMIHALTLALSLSRIRSTMLTRSVVLILVLAVLAMFVIDQGNAFNFDDSCCDIVGFHFSVSLGS